MNLYKSLQIETQIEKIAEFNDGEISEDELKALIETQTNSLIQIEDLCKYIKHLEYFQESAKKEEQRINDLRKKAEKRVDSIKKYITPYIEKHGKIESGIFTLSIRKSESVEVDENFVEIADSEYINYKEIITKSPDKDKIKKAIKTGKVIQGARIKENFNLQIK